MAAQLAKRCTLQAKLGHRVPSDPRVRADDGATRVRPVPQATQDGLAVKASAASRDCREGRVNAGTLPSLKHR